MTLVHRRVQPVLAHPDYDVIEEWTVTIVACPARGDWTTADEIGGMTLYRMRPDNPTGYSPPYVAEVDDHWLAEISRFLFDWDSSPRARFAEAVSSTDGDVLAVHDVRLAAEWQGRGIEAAVLAEAMWALADGCCAVVADAPVYPCPDHPTKADTRWPPVPSTTHDAVWPGLGFRPFYGMYLLDTARDEPRHLRERARAELAALGDTYRNGLPRV
ncbi:hypothetical protein [Streptomyces laurentii]|uniref:hypothetical protein n=1 Tax=Streptomyces laurentii TaxID=39478 RepID=UPI0036B27853